MGNSHPTCKAQMCTCSLFYKAKNDDDKCNDDNDCACEINTGAIVVAVIAVLGIFALIFAEYKFFNSRHNRTHYMGVE